MSGLCEDVYVDDMYVWLVRGYIMLFISGIYTVVYFEDI